MALTNVTGKAVEWGDWPFIGATPFAFRTVPLLDASTERAAFIGAVVCPARPSGGSVNIRKVHFRCGAVTFNALSAFRVSLQDVSATAGPPYQPDGTPDQTYTYAGSGLTANAWNTTGNLSADRTVTLGSRIAVVFEYTTFTAADSIVISSLDSIPTAAADAREGFGGSPLFYNGTSWALSNGAAIVAFELDDGTYAFFDQTYPVSALGTTSVSSTGAVRRAGAIFQFPFEVKVDGFWICAAIPDSCDGSFVLYDSDGTTALLSVSIDNDAVQAASGRYYRVLASTPITLAATTNYRLAFVGSTSTAATIYTLDVNDANHFGAYGFGPQLHYTEHNGTSWSETTTRRPYCGLLASAFHDGSGGAGGLAMPVSGRICA